MILPSCRAGKITGCRLLATQKRIAQTRDRLTTRVSKMNVYLLSDPRTAGIKGFYIPPIECAEGQGVVALGRVQLNMGVVEIQHNRLAGRLGFSVVSDTDFLSDSADPIGNFRLAEPDIWGFILLPIIFPSEPSCKFEQSRVINNLPGYSVDVSSQYVGLVKENGMAGLDKVKELQPRTAEKFWAEKIYGFMYSATDHIGTVWAVKTMAGLTGPIPYREVGKFLNVLARHVSPDFTILKFLRNVDGSLDKEEVNVARNESVYPSCLRWPEEMMLIKPQT